MNSNNKKIIRNLLIYLGILILLVVLLLLLSLIHICIVLRDRKHLAEDGLIIAVCTIEAGSGRVVSGPDIVSRGFVYVRESEALMDEARRLVNSTIEQCADENVREWSAIKLRVRDNLSRLLYNRTKRSPMILPIIMEV